MRNRSAQLSMPSVRKYRKSAVFLAILGLASVSQVDAAPYYVYRVAIPGIVAPTPPSTGGIVTAGAGRSWADGTYATSCLGYLNGGSGHTYTGATGDGAYTINVGGTPTVVWCDMTSDGGGWTLVAKGSANIIPSNWSTTTGAIQTTYLSNAGFTDGSGKLSDTDINSRKTIGIRLVGVYNSVTRVRYAKSTCTYGQTSQPSGDCLSSYASLSWNNQQTCSIGNASYRLGFCDFSAAGMYFYTADTRASSNSWFVGDGVSGAYGNATNTSFAMFVK